MTLLLLVLLAALVFEYINGFHDAANAIATVVSTRVLTPRQAILLAAIADLLGAILFGTAVATTIGSGLVNTSVITSMTVLAALLAAIIWGLVTWWLGLPSSSSHALIGGLCGAALATSHGNWSVLQWAHKDAVTGKVSGLWYKVVMPMITSPVVGFCVAALFMIVLFILLRKSRPRFVNTVFGKAQIGSALFMGLSHGANDAQKTMGIITLALYTGTQKGLFANLPDWLSFLVTPEFKVAKWVVILCAVTIAAGTASGGWRIIRTMGHKMVKLQPVHGFAAETSAASIIWLASRVGIPLSTTHVISTSIMGVGAIKRFSAVKWGVVGRIVWAWVLTLPVTALLGYSIVRIAHLCGVY
ncbi:MAG: inorganic phosphate transporter [Nibricoccus sp.]